MKQWRLSRGILCELRVGLVVDLDLSSSPPSLLTCQLQIVSERPGFNLEIVLRSSESGVLRNGGEGGKAHCLSTCQAMPMGVWTKASLTPLRTKASPV